MIPHTIQIKNFLSYGPELQTINFTPHHLIYLSGKNGHGKSALLDAITWAIWGQARKVSTAVKADQGLLRLGQTQMLVVLDFELDQTLYRVKREFTFAYGKATTNLEFGMINTANDEFIPLTDKTIKTTQEKIEHTIRLDYDAFVNSAFLRQGHANEFSQKSPKERKEILGSILGLQQFDLIKKRALEKVREAQNSKQALAQLEEKYQQELNKKEQINKDHKQVADELAQCHTQEQTLAKQKIELDSLQKLLHEHSKKQELILYKKQQHEKQLHEKTVEIIKVSKQWRTVLKKQRAGLNVEDIQKHKAQLVTEITHYQKQLHEQLKYKEQVLLIQGKLQEKKNDVHHTLMAQKQTIALELKKYEIEHVSLQKQSEELHKKIAELSKSKKITPEELQKLEAQFEKRKETYQQFITDGKWLTNERTNLQQKVELMQVDNPSCPVCEQNLSASRKMFLANTYTKRIKAIEHKINRLARIVKKLKAMLIVQHEELNTLKELQKKYEELQHAEKQKIELNKQLHEITAHLTKQTTLLSEHEKKEKELLQKDPDIVAFTKQLAELTKELQKNNYDEKLHTQKQDELKKVEKQLEELQMLQQEIIKQQERSQAIAQLINQAKEIKKQLLDHEKELKQFADHQTKQKEHVHKEHEYSQALQALLKQKEQLLEKRGSLENQIKQIQKIEQELQQHEKQISQLNQTIDDYQTIAQATGKDGIQALLIEEAIPEIEQEANELLSKLTNNQAQIFIESLRDLKKGGSKETLDIKISDATGIRPYEMFSGGEAFRIDFALRIAISKLLARRAGTALQTLIIDEGFGSQDEEGLSHIMDALYKIQDDFEKVIVVSHLPSMKDQFPVHFVVEKGATGSHIQIVEQA